MNYYDRHRSLMPHTRDLVPGDLITVDGARKIGLVTGITLTLDDNSPHDYMTHFLWIHGDGLIKSESREARASGHLPGSGSYMVNGLFSILAGTE